MSVAPSSPRLPSPPPPTEIQIGPKSASIVGSDHDELPNVEQSTIEANSKRRIHPGSTSANMATGPSLIPLSEEHLKALHCDFSKSSSHASTVPISRSSALTIATSPEGVDRALWLYELCRFVINKCNDLIVGFLYDSPPCSATTCPEMRASEWQFLCAVHDSPKSCCAIDYCCHTLDWATNVVTNQKIFPSRLSLGAKDLMAESLGWKFLANIFRRVHRIFAHAWFQHRQVYWSVESSTGLYTLFKIICDTYELMPTENTKLPPEAEGLEATEESRPVISILKSNSSSVSGTTIENDCLGSIGRTKTRRHIRQSPSVGSAVTTVLEADEDDDIVKQSFDDIEGLAREKEVEAPLSITKYEVDDDDVMTVKDGRTVELREDLTQAEIKIKEEFPPTYLDRVLESKDLSSIAKGPSNSTEVEQENEQKNKSNNDLDNKLDNELKKELEGELVNNLNNLHNIVLERPNNVEDHTETHDSDDNKNCDNNNSEKNELLTN